MMQNNHKFDWEGVKIFDYESSYTKNLFQRWYILKNNIIV